MQIKMSRVMFCQECFDNQRPHDELLFAVLGSTSHKVWVFQYEAPTNRELVKPFGFTPHFIVLDKIIKGTVHMIVSCGCNQCGSSITYSTENGWSVDIVKVKETTISIDDYLALEVFTDSGYKL